ncbi:MAG: hypothetical protein Q8S31_05315 [Alphaproteobacteria bacterium]|nr:hypothetical protein [Alphaproteobacteria bacterium]
MKKIVLTLSILLASPIFNCCAAGLAHRPAALTYLQTQEHLALAQNDFATTFDRFQACMTLLNFAKHTKNQVIPIIFTIIEENNITEISKHVALNTIWRDREARTTYHDTLMIHYLDLIQNSPDKFIRVLAFDDLLFDQQILHQYEQILQDAYKKHIDEDFDNFELKLKAYLIFGESFHEAYNQFINEYWLTRNNNQKQGLLQRMINKFGADHPCLQELDSTILPNWSAKFLKIANTAEAKNKQILDDTIIQD